LRHYITAVKPNLCLHYRQEACPKTSAADQCGELLSRRYSAAVPELTAFSFSPDFVEQKHALTTPLKPL
jgi:hypothetical protein